jgi:hypothetical protein
VVSGTSKGLPRRSNTFNSCVLKMEGDGVGGDDPSLVSQVGRSAWPNIFQRATTITQYTHLIWTPIMAKYSQKRRGYYVDGVCEALHSPLQETWVRKQKHRSQAAKLLAFSAICRVPCKLKDLAFCPQTILSRFLCKCTTYTDEARARRLVGRPN